MTPGLSKFNSLTFLYFLILTRGHRSAHFHSTLPSAWVYAAGNERGAAMRLPRVVWTVSATLTVLMTALG